MSTLYVREGDDTRLDCYRPPIQLATYYGRLSTKGVRSIDLTVIRDGDAMTTYHGPPASDDGNGVVTFPSEVWDKIHQRAGRWLYDFRIDWGDGRFQVFPTEGCGVIEVRAASPTGDTDG